MTSVAGSAAWIGYDGRSYDANTNASDGFLEITPAVNSQSGTVIFPDFDNGAVVQGVYVRLLGPDREWLDHPGGWLQHQLCPFPRPQPYPVITRSTPGNSDAEEGTRTGIAVGFDAYDNGTTPPDPSALDIWVDGVQVFQFPMTNQNGSVTDPTSLQTGPIDADNPGSYLSLGWAHLVVNLSTNGLLNVYYKDFQILTNFATGYCPSPGQLVMAGRTGGLNENQDVDDITITTTVAQNVVAGAATGLARRCPGYILRLREHWYI